MNRNWFKPFSFAVLAFSLFSASCDNLPTDPTTPDQQSASVKQTPAPSAPVAPQSFSQFNGPVSAITTADGYHIVSANPLQLRLGSNLLGLLGGILNVGNQKLTVPLGSVLQPTLFTMVQLPTPYISVQLSAIATNLLGVIDIGAKGFQVPVQLSLSYANAIGVTNASHLKIAELKSDGTIGVILPTTVNTTTKTVSASLPHFSSWVVICD